MRKSNHKHYKFSPIPFVHNSMEAYFMLPMCTKDTGWITIRNKEANKKYKRKRKKIGCYFSFIASLLVLDFNSLTLKLHCCKLLHDVGTEKRKTIKCIKSICFWLLKKEWLRLNITWVFSMLVDSIFLRIKLKL